MLTDLRRIKVAMVIQRYLPHIGGAELQLSHLAPLLQRRGIEVRIFTRRFQGLPRAECVGNIEVRRIDTPGPKSMASLAFTFGALYAMGSWKPHLIHAHELLSPATTALVGKALWRVPVVAKVLATGKQGDIAKLRRTADGRRRLAAVIGQVDAFAVINSGIDEELSLLGVSAERRRFIPNGVDTQRFSPPENDSSRSEARRAFGVADDRPIALSCGRISPDKRLIELARAWSDSHPGDDSELWIAGIGPQEHELQMGLPAVRYLGKLDDVSPALRAADVYVQPSVEGLSNATLEAMASALPVVSIDAGGAHDLLAGTGAGVLVGSHDMRHIVAALRELLADKRAWSPMGAAGRRHVSANYSLQTTADKLALLYTELIKRGMRNTPVEATR